MKRMSRFHPPLAIGRDRAEQHYSQVHHPFARRLFREHGDLVTRYVANRADSQYSLRGRFEEEPSAWRFVITEVADGQQSASAWIPDWAQSLIWVDHRKCIERIEAWEVDETVPVDLRCGQMALAKFLFVYSSDESSHADRLQRYREHHVPSLAQHFREAFGARLYLSNIVQRQAATSDEYGDGAAYTGDYAPAASVLALDEFYFDNAEWADEFFSAAEVVALMRDSDLGRAEGYAVSEFIGVDKRIPER